MKFLREHLSIILVLIMSSLCIFSIGTAIHVTIVMIEKRDQVVKSTPVQQHVPAKDQGEAVNPGKLKAQPVYFNGIQLDGFRAYTNGKEDTYIPIDQVFEQLKIPYQYYNADDILEWTLAGKKYRTKIGDNRLWTGTAEIHIPAAIAGRSHILVSLELLTHLSGFNFQISEGFNTLFLNYYPGSDKVVGKLKALRRINGAVFITSLPGDKLYWGNKESVWTNESILTSPTAESFLLKAKGKVYLYGADQGRLPGELKINPSADWSLTGKSLFWNDDSKDANYVYDVKAGQTRKLGDYYQKLPGVSPGEGDSAWRFYDYMSGSRYKRAAFSTESGEANYSFIDRSGKTVLEGNLSYSPDRQKIIYFLPDKGYYMSNADGTKKVLLGSDIQEARWINNSRIWLKTKSGNLVSAKGGKNFITSDADWRMLGQAPGGEIFFTCNQSLYYEKNGKDTAVMTLPWAVDRVYVQSVKGPFMVVSRQGNGIYFATDSVTRKVASYTAPVFTDNKPVSWDEINLKLSFSPDGKQIALLQENAGFVDLILVDTKQGSSRKVTLNFSSDEEKMKELSIKWISGSVLSVFSKDQWNIMDTNGDIKIFQSSESGESTLFGISTR